MCRLYGFRANEETKVECSLVHAQNALLLQSQADLRGKSHPDGWGIAFYHGALPEVERRATPAFRDLYFSETAERIYTTTVVAHVRLATVGGASLENSHPFTCGVWVFAHNGTLTGFDVLRPDLLQETHQHLRRLIKGNTDSEHIFYWLLSRLEDAGIAVDRPCDDPETLLDVMARSLRDLSQRSRQAGAEKPARLNLLLSDGQLLVASRWNNSLYWALREGIHDCEFCGIPHVHHHSGVNYRAAIIASEPITHETWHELPDHSLLIVDADIRPQVRPIDSVVQGETAASSPSPSKAGQ